MKLSIIIPCFNEEKTIIEIIQRVKNSLSSLNISHEIIVIDDNSTDKTSDILKNDLNNIVDKLIHNPRNSGKGYSIQKGIEIAKGEFILTWPFAVIAPAVSNLPNEPVEVTELLTFAKKVASPSAAAKFRAWL